HSIRSTRGLEFWGRTNAPTIAHRMTLPPERHAEFQREGETAHGDDERVERRPFGAQLFLPERARLKSRQLAFADSKDQTADEIDAIVCHPASPPSPSVMTVSTYAPFGPDSTRAASFSSPSSAPVLCTTTLLAATPAGIPAS